MTLRRRILWRILALLTLLIAVTGAAMATVQVALNRRQTLEHYVERAQILVRQLEPLFLWDDRVAIQEALLHTVRGEKLVRYAFVERDGQVIAHTLASGVPSDLLVLEKASEHATIREFADENGRVFHDLAIARAPDSDTLHLGLDRSRIDQVGYPALVWIVAIGGVFLLLLIYPAWRVAGTITSEVLAMTERLERANERLEERVAERTVELSEAMLRLDEEREKLAVTLRSIGDGVITTDLNGVITTFNRKAEELTGWKQHAAIGQRLREVLHVVLRESGEEIEDPVARVLRSGGSIELPPQALLIAKDGCERVIADCGAPIRDPYSRIIGVVLVFRDVTDKERAELELNRSEKLDSIALLAAGIAHDFNNLLTTIIGNVNLAELQMDVADPALEFIKCAEEASVRAKDLARRLITFAKGSSPIKKANDIETLARDAANLALSGSKTRCRFDVRPGLPSVHVDAGQIGQVFHNLLINAAHAMPEGGEVTIRCDAVVSENLSGSPLAPGLYVRVVVEDQGIGISSENLGRLFDPFFTTKPKGSGLGLAIVHSIVSSHGGRVSVTSKLGEGTQFTILLPTTGELPETTTAELRTLGKGEGKILVMDDETALSEVVANVLRRMGYQVECAAHGEDAIEKCLAANKDGCQFLLLILDLTIPGGLGGKETLRRLRERGVETTAIASSGYSSDPIMTNPRDYGFFAALAKPFDIFELCQMILNVTSKQETRSSDSFS